MTNGRKHLVSAALTLGALTLAACAHGATSDTSGSELSAGFCLRHPTHPRCRDAGTSPSDTGTASADSGPSPTPAYPASFFTGPLGANNIVPTDPNGALLVMWSGVAGIAGGASGQRAFLQQRLNDIGRTPDGIGTQIDTYTVSGETSEAWIHGLGAIPIISWSPSGTIADVNNGLRDAEIAAVADRFKASRFRIVIRMYHEFNGDWFPWSATLANAADWVRAWRRVVTLFHDRGATNVGFGWSNGEGQDRAVRDACYPGDAYVDWVMPDSYNTCISGACWATPFHSGFAELREMFDYTTLGSALVSTYSAYGGRKPFVIGETASKYDATDVNRKGNWYRNIDVARSAMPWLMGIEVFDQDVRLFEPTNNFRVDQTDEGAASPESYQGFKDFVAIPRWNVGAVGGPS